MKLVRYAAYGSNLHPLRLGNRLPAAQLITTGHLPDWTLRFHKRGTDRSGKCSILAGGDGVHFAIYEMTRKDKLALDKIEGVGSGYAEITLSIPGVGDCASYIAEESHIEDSLQPYDWYQALVLIGARFHEFPDDYLQQIASIAAIQDPKPNRRAVEWRTVAMVKGGA